MQEVPPRYWSTGRTDEFLRKISETVRGLLDGRSNNVFRVTLSDTGTETVIDAPSAMSDQIANLTPISASAAAQASTTYATVTNGKITVTHAEGGSDRQFGIILQG